MYIYQLEDLYVSPSHRNAGMGKAMFGHLAKIAQENNCARLDWAVLKVCCWAFCRGFLARSWRRLFVSQWNTPSIKFYENTLGAKGMKEWEGMRLEEEGIENAKKFLRKD